MLTRLEVKAHDRNLTIQSPAKMSREQWFIDAIDEAPDYLYVLYSPLPSSVPSPLSSFPDYLVHMFCSLSLDILTQQCTRRAHAWTR